MSQEAHREPPPYDIRARGRCAVGWEQREREERGTGYYILCDVNVASKPEHRGRTVRRARHLRESGPDNKRHHERLDGRGATEVSAASPYVTHRKGE